MTAPRPVLTRLELTNYRAFAEPVTLDIAPLTFLIGRNNMGKSSLLRAPRLLSRVLDPTADPPFDLGLDGLDHGGRLTDLCYAGGLTFDARLTVEHGDQTSAIDFQAAAPSELGYTQFLNRLTLEPADAPPETYARERDWLASRARIARHPVFASVHRGTALLTAARDRLERAGVVDTAARHTIGPRGEHLAALMWTTARSDLQGLDPLNTWLARIADRARAEITLTEDQRLLVWITRPREPRVPLLDCGSGITQLLPLIAALTLTPPEHRPTLFAIEQPEAELHPAAHPEVAELLIAAATAPGGPRLLVETHSDPLLLRVRAALAEQRLKPAQVRFHVVDAHPDVGSQLRTIPLDDRGTPAWWPEGLFAEPAHEFRRILRALAKRDRQP